MNVTLKELHVCTFSMTDTGAEWICRSLKDNPSLRILAISR